jgi:hypothetical protein
MPQSSRVIFHSRSQSWERQPIDGLSRICGHEVAARVAEILVAWHIKVRFLRSPHPSSLLRHAQLDRSLAATTASSQLSKPSASVIKLKNCHWVTRTSFGFDIAGVEGAFTEPTIRSTVHRGERQFPRTHKVRTNKIEAYVSSIEASFRSDLTVLFEPRRSRYDSVHPELQTFADKTQETIKETTSSLYSAYKVFGASSTAELL